MQIVLVKRNEKIYVTGYGATILDHSKPKINKLEHKKETHLFLTAFLAVSTSLATSGLNFSQ
jgi:hypothetical protein